MLSLRRYRIDSRSDIELNFPSYPGSAWRGAFGHALKKLACTHPGLPCQDCTLYRTCTYSYIFETPPPVASEKMRKYTSVPHPYVLYPMPADDAGDLGLELTLFGRAQASLPQIVGALALAGSNGLGKDSARLHLRRVAQERTLGAGDWLDIGEGASKLRPLEANPPTIPPMPNRVVIHFITPLRLLHQEKLVKPRELRVFDLIRSLLSRQGMLLYFHQGIDWQVDYRALLDQAVTVPMATGQLKWHDWSRYSSRQGRPVKMGGIVGQSELDLTHVPELWPILWMGQWTHAAKGAVMGLGRYRLSW